MSLMSKNFISGKMHMHKRTINPTLVGFPRIPSQVKYICIKGLKIPPQVAVQEFHLRLITPA